MTPHEVELERRKGSKLRNDPKKMRDSPRVFAPGGDERGARFPVSVASGNGKITIDRPGVGHWAVVRRDWKLFAGIAAAAALVALVWSALSGSFDVYNSWVYEFILAQMAAMLVVLEHIERRRLGWVIFADEHVVRIAQDKAWNWISDELPRNENVEIWMKAGPLGGGALYFANAGPFVLELRSDLDRRQALALGQLLADFLGLEPTTGAERYQRWKSPCP